MVSRTYLVNFVICASGFSVISIFRGAYFKCPIWIIVLPIINVAVYILMVFFMVQRHSAGMIEAYLLLGNFLVMGIVFCYDLIYCFGDRKL